MNDPLAQFELLLEAGKIEEAKAMLDTLARRPLSAQEEADAKILRTRLSIKLTNAINRAYLDTLNESIERLKELGGKSRTLSEAVTLANTRAELAK